MASESLCVKSGRIFVKHYMLHVGLLKYGAVRSLSSLRSLTTSIFAGLNDVVRILFGFL